MQRRGDETSHPRWESHGGRKRGREQIRWDEDDACSANRRRLNRARIRVTTLRSSHALRIARWGNTRLVVSRVRSWFRTFASVLWMVAWPGSFSFKIPTKFRVSRMKMKKKYLVHDDETAFFLAMLIKF